MQFALLERQNLSPVHDIAIYTDIDLATLQRVLPEGQTWAIDLETNGLDVTDPDTFAVGIGLANDTGALYLDLQSMPTASLEWLIGWLQRQQFVAFNIFFDGAFLLKLTGTWLNFIGDVYGLYRQLSSEGHPGQKYNLESLQLLVLGWPTSNKGVLEAALAERGLTKGEMWKLPPSILGTYCALDSESTWQGWRVLYETCIAKLSPGRVS